MIAWVLARMATRSRWSKSERRLMYFAGFGPEFVETHGLGTLDQAIRFARMKDAIQLANGWSQYVNMKVCQYDFTDEDNPILLQTLSSFNKKLLTPALFES